VCLLAQGITQVAGHFEQLFGERHYLPPDRTTRILPVDERKVVGRDRQRKTRALGGPGACKLAG
jgi:hypothetical protein